MRTILHCDCNGFYATVEMLFDPSLRGKPVVVCGDSKLRHGIVLAKSEKAKACGIKTGDALWEAQKKCPPLVLVPANQQMYLAFSRRMRAICRRYTALVEPFGLDESWLDVSGHLLSGEEIAAQLRKAAKEELGITVSVGVSFNKAFAKLGSDMRKPDATTVISRENYREKIWPLPASDLLFVGRSTSTHLQQMGLNTIGDVATASPNILKKVFGVNGLKLWRSARGEDNSPVIFIEEAETVKSISNSTTTPHDICTPEEAKVVLYLLSDSVATRLRKHQLRCRTISVWMRDVELNNFERQCRLPTDSDIASEIAHAAVDLFTSSYPWSLPLRSLGVRGGDLLNTTADCQIPLCTDARRQRHHHLEEVLDDIRSRWGHTCIQRALLLQDRALTGINPVDDHALQPLAAMYGRE
ncbi:MAG: DNA polymerase IV [Clostridiales bacterium]|nr:DNA polymerase IV [Clostridiales bacterium]